MDWDEHDRLVGETIGSMRPPAYLPCVWSFGDEPCTGTPVAWACSYSSPEHTMPVCHYHFYEEDHPHNTWDALMTRRGITQEDMHEHAMARKSYYDPKSSCFVAFPSQDSRS